MDVPAIARSRRVDACRDATMNSRCSSVGGAPAIAARDSQSSAWRSSSPRTSGLACRPAACQALARTSRRVCRRTTSMSVSSARTSCSMPRSKLSPERIMIQLKSRIASGTTAPSEGSSMQIGINRLLAAAAYASSLRHATEPRALALRTNTNASERSIASFTDSFQSLAGSTPAPSSHARSTHTSRSWAANAARRRTTNAPSTRA